MKSKIKINMLSQADMAPGQGVSSAYHEQVNLVKQSPLLEVYVNESSVEVDIYHHHTINPTHALAMFSKNYKHVAYVHFLPETLDGSIELNALFEGVFKKYLINFYSRADYLVVVNPIFIDMLAAYDIPKEKISYIPNYVSDKEFYLMEQEEINEVRKKYDIDEDAFVVIGVGQVQTRKGVMDFIDVAKQMPDIQFVWAGGFSFGFITDGYKELKEVYENPPSNVKFIGIVERAEMNGLYNAANVLFMPSYNELFPMSILEAINSKLPLLLRNLELYEGILFNKYNIASDNEGFITEIRKLKDNEDHYQKAREMSYEISQFYTAGHVLHLWEEFYQRVYQDLLEDIGAQEVKKKDLLVNDKPIGKNGVKNGKKE